MSTVEIIAVSLIVSSIWSMFEKEDLYEFALKVSFITGFSLLLNEWFSK